MEITSGKYGNCLPYANIWFSIRFSGSGTLPSYRGATLRGALGFTLKNTVCHLKGGRCLSCPVVSNCVYSTLFEGVAPPDRNIMEKYDTIPQPFVFILDRADKNDIQQGQSWSFGIRLFGSAIKQLPYLAYTIIQMGKSGLGHDKIPYQLLSAVQRKSDGTQKLLYHPDNPNISQPEADWPVFHIDYAYDDDAYLRIHYLTPVKYRYRGHLCGKPNFDAFMMAAVRRLRIMTSFYGHELELSSVLSAADNIELVEDKTRLMSFNRFSNRQKASMRMAGIVGQATYRGDFRNIMPVLKLAELTHVGKATSFGFGRIATEFVSREAV